MRVIQSRYLSDGRGFNHGQPASLIELESPGDLEELLQNILRTGYYDRAYFESHSGQRDGYKIPHFWFVAQMVARMEARSVIDVGCGRGDVLWFLQKKGLEVQGVDFSAAADQSAWPELRGRFEYGDLAESCQRLAQRGRRYDTLCGFDIWEHLLPSQLHRSLEALGSLATDDGLLFTVIPAFGNDRIFGEPFPLELEENRAAFDAREPFRYLLAERLDPPIPASGHLIWAHTEWWEAQFTSLGWRRETALERALHAAFDELLPLSVRAFYVLSRSRAGALRAERAASAIRPGRTQASLTYGVVQALLRGELKRQHEAESLLRPLVLHRLPPGVRKAAKRGVTTVRRFLPTLGSTNGKPASPLERDDAG